MLLAFGATAGGEFVREGSRKPYTVRHVLFSNGIRPEEVAELRIRGCVTNDPYPVIHEQTLPNDMVTVGARVFRRQCAVCHTMEGSNAVAHLTASWDADQMRMNIAKLQQTKPFMPPFAGTATELESLIQYILWVHDGRPKDWRSASEPDAIAQIEKWLDEAGTEPADVSSQTTVPKLPVATARRTGSSESEGSAE